MDNVEITVDQIVKCTQFVDQVISSNLEHYKSRGQVILQKVKDDIFLGKIAEFGVYNYLMERSGNCSEPDLNVYEKKSYDPDLICEGFNIHVKSCRYDGDSWVFQKNDPIITRPSTRDFIFLCKHTKSNCIYIVKILKAWEAKYSPVRKKSLSSKVCIYEKDF